MGPLKVWPMVKSTRRYIGTALRGALYTLSYLLFVVYVMFLLPLEQAPKVLAPSLFLCMDRFAV